MTNFPTIATFAIVLLQCTVLAVSSTVRPVISSPTSSIKSVLTKKKKSNQSKRRSRRLSLSSSAESVVDDVIQGRYDDSKVEELEEDILGVSSTSLDLDREEDGGVVDEEEEGDGIELGEGSEKEALYEAYNQLHSLAQDFHKPFDAPAVVVVGHQSSGKSALIEALMGFQFNQVGGGTKTRRPISLRMQYNPNCSEPRCYLRTDVTADILDDDDNSGIGKERPATLSEIQQYIDAENQKLERDPNRCFDPREIHIRMEYKYCPNMILIDTPGLIAAPRIPRSSTPTPPSTSSSTYQQRLLRAQAREAERVVISKLKCPDYIILCVEDTMDWKHGTTRSVVQKADPDLSRTVIVNTKLETKIPQFGSNRDVVEFLKADIVERLSPGKLGGPFFTSVPSGRVGRMEGIGRGNDYLFGSDDDFVSSCAETEETDRAVIDDRLRKFGMVKGGKKNDAVASKELLSRVGLSNLRKFLESRVDERYRRNVAKILPLLQAEQDMAESKLKQCERDLEALSVDRLKSAANTFCDDFCSSLREAIEGSVVAPPNLFGETIEQEAHASCSFHDIQGSPMAVSPRTYSRLTATEVGNQNHRLYGGSQYHRTMREFNLAARCLRPPSITEDEIANAAGVGTTHDGVNFLRAACVIALEKARNSFDPLLDALRIRMCHVVERLYPVSEYMLRQKNMVKGSTATLYGLYPRKGKTSTGEETVSLTSETDIAQNPHFRELVQTIFNKFVQKCSDATMSRCYDDLVSLTRFVSWDLQEQSGGALQRSLPDQTDIVSVYRVAIKAAKKFSSKDKSQNDVETGENTPNTTAITETNSPVLSPINTEEEDMERDYYNLLQLMEEAASSRDADRTSLVVGGLVQHIVSQWRETFGKSVTTKFNCYFLLPFVDEFHRFLRHELQKVYDEGEKGVGGDDLGHVFDVARSRKVLQERRQELISECRANERLREKFEDVASMMRNRKD